MSIRSIKNIPGSFLKDKRVLLRADFDVPVGNGKILDDFRILANLPSIKFILKKGGRLRIISHLGRPGGRPLGRLSLRPAAFYLKRRLGKKIIFAASPLDDAFFKGYAASAEILIYENLRFFPGEEKNDPAFARKLARWGDVYVNECFAASHRKHASFDALPRLLPSFAGLNLEKEVDSLARIFHGSARPVTVVLGGAKLETKLPLIEKFLRSGAWVLVGGALANTAFAAMGYEVGKSAVEKEMLPKMKKILKSRRFHSPLDIRVARSPNSGSGRIASPDGIKTGETVLDIGPRTLKDFATVVKKARTVFWNGPLGYAEFSPFSFGTEAFAKLLSRVRAFKVVGGGDTITFLRRRGLLREFDHVSTGGGSMLEFLSGKKLPGLGALKNTTHGSHNTTHDSFRVS